MKTKIYLLFITLAVIFAGCSEDNEGDGGVTITLPNSGDANQSAYADENSTGSGFTFEAKSNWTAVVTESTAGIRATESPGGSVPDSGSEDGKVTWLKLLYNGTEKYSGGAGKFILAISLEPNYTGKSRSAKIEIICGTDKIIIYVSQDSLTEDKKEPVDPNPVTDITLNPTSLSLFTGENAPLTATVQPSNATIQSVVWSSNRPEIATVNAAGVVTALMPGTATITVKSSVYGEITAQCDVTIKDPSQPQPKLITSIAVEGYDLMYREDYTQLWEIAYDEQYRVTRYEEMSDQYALYTFEYPAYNQMIFRSYDKGEDAEPAVVVATINSSGYITQTRYQDSQDYLFRFTYRDGYLNQITSEYETIIDDREKEPEYKTVYVYRTFNWQNNNLLRYIYTYTGSDDKSSFPWQSDCRYSSHLNEVVNIDLNMLLMDDGFGNYNQVLSLFGFLGKRSINLLDGDFAHLEEYSAPGHGGMVSYTEKIWNGNTDVQYTFDADGYVTEIYTTVGWVENEVIIATGEKTKLDEYTHNYRYVIGYSE